MQSNILQIKKYSDIMQTDNLHLDFCLLLFITINWRKNMWWIYIIVLAVYIFCPKYLRLLICVANFFVPDMLPVIDEVVMVAGMFLPGPGDD